MQSLILKGSSLDPALGSLGSKQLMRTIAAVVKRLQQLLKGELWRQRIQMEE